MASIASKNLYMQILKQAQLKSKSDKMVCTDGGREEAGMSEARDCTVRALAIAARIPYAEAHAHLSKHGRGNRKGVKTDILKEAYRQYVGEHIRVAAAAQPTVAAFLRSHPVGTYIVKVRGHVFAVIDGIQHDNGGFLNRPRCRVLGFWTA